MNIKQNNETFEMFRSSILDSIKLKSELSKAGSDAVLAAITSDLRLRAVIEAWAHEIVKETTIEDTGVVVTLNYSHMAVAATCFFLAGIDFAKKLAEDMLTTPKDTVIQ